MDNGNSETSVNNGQVITPGLEIVPGRKRPRVWTPEKGGKDFDWVKKVEEDVIFCKGKIGTAALAIKADKVANQGASLERILNDTMVSIVERKANTFSDFVAHYVAVRDENLYLRG
jgi:hypothetical protein